MVRTGENSQRFLSASKVSFEIKSFFFLQKLECIHTVPSLASILKKIPSHAFHVILFGIAGPVYRKLKRKKHDCSILFI